MRLMDQFERLRQWDGRRQIRSSDVPQHDLSIAQNGAGASEVQDPMLIACCFAEGQLSLRGSRFAAFPAEQGRNARNGAGALNYKPYACCFVEG